MPKKNITKPNRRALDKGPKRLTPPREDGLVISVTAVNEKSTPAIFKRRIEVARQELQKAINQPSGPYAIRLRTTAKVTLILGDKKKVFHTGSICVSEDSDEVREVSKDEAWKVTFDNVMKVFKALLRYADFAEEVFVASKNAAVAPPVEHPNLYFSRFVRPLFGTRFKKMHEELRASRRKEAHKGLERRVRSKGQPTRLDKVLDKTAQTLLEPDINYQELFDKASLEETTRKELVDIAQLLGIATRRTVSGKSRNLNRRELRAAIFITMKQLV